MELSLRAIFVIIRILFRYTDNSLDLCLCKNDKIMRGKITLLLMALTMMSCSEDRLASSNGIDYHYGRDLSHEKIVLGDRLENPYKTENITKALMELYPTKADRVDVQATDLYVRFLPKTEEEYNELKSLGLVLLDHPMDYEIVKEGDWYHDPEVPEGEVTWQYAVVPHDFIFPDMEYEIIDQCYLAENDAGTRADDGIDWDAVERQAYMMTGNGDMLEPQTKASKVYPSGRISIVDDDYNGGQPVGVAGVRVSCNVFVKFAHCYTDADGYYSMPKKFSMNPRYRLVFENIKGFAIGFNLLLVPASYSTLGKASKSGVNMTVTKDSESKLFKRCVVNNAGYDYYSRCDVEDLNLTTPPGNLRIWIFHKLAVSSSVMLHHGAIIDMDLISSFLGEFASLLKVFLPDITLGLSKSHSYKSIYGTAAHEFAHASHFSEVGTSYWNKYILYMIGSYVATGGMTYGDGQGLNAGCCAISEMWAYYMESKLSYDRYGGQAMIYGASYWFYPHIFWYLDALGISSSDILSVLNHNMTSVDELERALIASNRDKAAAVELIFDRYR